MRPARFQEFAVDALAAAPDVQAVEPWQEADGSRPFGLCVRFTSGAQLWVAITHVLAPGEKLTDSEAPVKGDPAPILDYPALYDDKMISPARAEAYLVAALTHAQSEEISSAYAYGEQPQNPGFGVHFHNESKIYCPFVFTARQGQSRGSRAFDLQAAF